MEKAKVHVMNLLVLATIIAVLPSKTQALMPYTRPFFDLMFPQEDPIKILEQTPLTIPKGIDQSIALLARTDWKETSKEHIISLDIPGMKKEDIKIEVEENRVLRISGERKTEEENIEGEKWHRVERTSGKFWRQFKLPRDVDLEHIKANLENGVLKITVPKLAEEEKKQGKVISISEPVVNGEDIKATKAAM
ncbi:22.7 kDa class IV heat shock protein-like [Solanum dulcamara]|uniref:22.7 kDa class IV heat shock protein-like n=1 Tax=Solanum dulcamara TaxID=45834 RepID=UPI0024856E14|nr:22.7 kDa class IV heat shock protein-like [Solanum dulcamara]